MAKGKLKDKIKSITEKINLKELKNTPFGIWLKENDSDIFYLLEDMCPDKKGWRLIKKLLKRLGDMTDENVLIAGKMIDKEIKNV